VRRELSIAPRWDDAGPLCAGVREAVGAVDASLPAAPDEAGMVQGRRNTPVTAA